MNPKDPSNMPSDQPEETPEETSPPPEATTPPPKPGMQLTGRQPVQAVSPDRPRTERRRRMKKRKTVPWWERNAPALVLVGLILTAGLGSWFMISLMDRSNASLATTQASMPAPEAEVEETQVVVEGAIAESPAPETAAPIPQAANDLLNEALARFQERDYTACLEVVERAMELYPDRSEFTNLAGACYAKLDQYEQAKHFFEQAILQAPGTTTEASARFNLAEIEFLRRNYAGALESFQKLRMESERPEVRELANYKVYLSLLILDKHDEAEALLVTLDPYGEFPTYFFCHAAKEFHAGNADAGRNFIDRANKLFSDRPQICSLFMESLEDLGWMPKVDAESEKAGS